MMFTSQILKPAKENKNNMAGWVIDTEGNSKPGIRITPDGGSEILKLLKGILFLKEKKHRN
ncbi:MAG: hypothetical protein WAM24_10175 [Ignavibacteriaceae bacterium]